MNLNIAKNNQGFSLMELIIYMAIFSGFMIVIADLFFAITANSAREEARAEVQQNLRFAIRQIADEIYSASDIIQPTSGNPGNTLDLTVNGPVTRFNVSSGTLQKIRELSTENITGDKVTVSAASPIFTRIENIGAKATIQINLQISYNDNGRPDYKFSQTVRTAISLRK